MHLAGMNREVWINLSMDLDDILDRASAVDPSDCPENATVLLGILEDTTNPDRIRRNAAYAIESLPPEPGMTQPWPEAEAISITDRLIGLLERSPLEISEACLGAALAIIHHSIPDTEFRELVIKRLKSLTKLRPDDIDRAVRIISKV